MHGFYFRMIRGSALYAVVMGVLVLEAFPVKGEEVPLEKI
jgi:hypothetical protein